MSSKIYVLAFKELIDEVVRECRDDPQRARDLIVGEVLREAREAFELGDYREVEEYARERLAELGVSID